MVKRQMIRSVGVVAAVTLLLCLPATSDCKEPRPDSCLDCHGSAERMASFGFPHFTVTEAEVEEQSGMSAGCSDCHLGDPAKADREEAHRGMGRWRLVMKKGLRAETVARKFPLEKSGDPVLRLKPMMEKEGRKVVDPAVTALLAQDKRSDTLSQDFDVMEKTCGKCHHEEFEQFKRSPMGRNAKQSQYGSWDDPRHGPHNCGVWSAGNYRAIAGNTAVPFTRELSDLNQRTCNGCHVGCLDCHYRPEAASGTPGKGMHTFVRIPPPDSCYGGGRGALCHGGPEDRRRGAGYFGGPYSHPEGMPPDPHAKAKVGCLDCHQGSRDDRSLEHATFKRQARCEKCHPEAVATLGVSLHRKLSCEACHITNVGGYQATFWGPGKLAGYDTPYFKYKDYYGIMKEPILLRDQRGRWIPVKPFPMAVLNQKSSRLEPGLHWRYPAGLPDLQRTDDAWGYVGLVDGLPEGNKALLWIQMDKLSHKYGKSRPCASCHTKEGQQLQEIAWEFSDAGAFPFNGRHTVVANRDGLFIKGIRADEKIDVAQGYRLSSLAPWFYLKDAWAIKGDFSLPVIAGWEAAEKLYLKGSVVDKGRIIHR
ncbi:cytochrome c [Geomonas sp. Red276]